MPIKFLGHAASNGMPQPSRHNVHIYLRPGATFAVWTCHAVPLCAARHSVDAPLCNINSISHCNDESVELTSSTKAIFNITGTFGTVQP